MIIYKNKKPYIEGVSIDDIIQLHQTPMYVYSQQCISNNYINLKKNLNAEIFYALKANSNQAIIKLMNSLGAGADAVSLGELKKALNVGINPKKIIFEGVAKTKEDILFAIENNIRLINIESVEELEKINSIGSFLNKVVDVGIRINPNIDGKMLDKISTGKNTDKFGISISNFKNFIHSIKESKNLNFIGISCHVGSQILDLNIFKQIFEYMKNISKEFLREGINIKHLDLGGGLGVQYKIGDPELQLQKLGELFSSIFIDMPYSLSFEPGRYLVANAGVIISKIITTKNNGGINYLITDAGMNTFIRPSLYNAEHKIEALNSSSESKIKYTVAGPICESSDIILKNIILPKQTSGNYLIIKDVGAYGSVMASNYNSRGLPVEILVCDSNLAVIHKPLTMQEIIDQDNIPSWL